MVFRCGKQQRNRISSPTWKAVKILSMDHGPMDKIPIAAIAAIAHHVYIECHPRTTKVIKLSCLSTVKAMDYIEGTRVNCVAQLRSDKAKTETIKRHPKRWENARNYGKKDET